MIKERQKLYKAVLRYVACSFEPAKIKRILRLRKNSFSMLFEDLIDQGLVEKKGKLFVLTKDGKSEIKAANSYLCKCLGSGLSFEKIVSDATKYCKMRTKANELIDQCPVTAEDLAARVAFIHEQGDIDDKSILCVGDNDLASLMIAKVGAPKEITVIDKDERVLGTIRKATKKAEFPINLIHWDISSILDGKYPPEIEGRYDVFQTDPPYTEVGFKCFMAMGMIGLKRYGSCYVVVPHMSLEQWSNEVLYHVEDFLLRHKFVITNALPGFQTFVHEHEVVSSLIRAERTGSIVQPFNALKNLNKDKFYTIRGISND